MSDSSGRKDRMREMSSGGRFSSRGPRAEGGERRGGLMKTSWREERAIVELRG